MLGAGSNDSEPNSTGSERAGMVRSQAPQARSRLEWLGAKFHKLDDSMIHSYDSMIHSMIQ